MSHSIFTKYSYLESNITPFCLGGCLYGIKVVKNILHVDEDVTHIKEGCFSEEVIKHIQNSEETIDTICFHSNIYLMSHSITSTSIKNLVFLDGVRFNKECFYDLKSNRYHRYIVFINKDLVDAAELFKTFPKLNVRDINDFDKLLEMNKYYDPSHISSLEVGHRFDTYESKTYKEDWLDFIKYDNHNNPFCFIELIVHKLELMINYFKSKLKAVTTFRPLIGFEYYF